MAASGLKVAPMWRRLAAGAIDFLLVVIPIIGAVGVWMGYRRLRGYDDGGFPELSLSDRWDQASEVVSTQIQIAARNWRSPGYRALGLRRVDPRTGGPVTLRSAIIQAAVIDLFSRTTRTLMQPWRARYTRRLEAIQAEVKEAQRAHAHDKQAMQQAVMRIYKRENVHPLRGCLPAILVGAVPQVTRLFSPLHQSLPECAAGTVVVLED